MDYSSNGFYSISNAPEKDEQASLSDLERELDGASSSLIVRTSSCASLELLFEN